MSTASLSMYGQPTAWYENFAQCLSRLSCGHVSPRKACARPTDTAGTRPPGVWPTCWYAPPPKSSAKRKGGRSNAGLPGSRLLIGEAGDRPPPSVRSAESPGDGGLRAGRYNSALAHRCIGHAGGRSEADRVSADRDVCEHAVVVLRYVVD